MVEITLKRYQKSNEAKKTTRLVNKKNVFPESEKKSDQAAAVRQTRRRSVTTHN